MTTRDRAILVAVHLIGCIAGVISSFALLIGLSMEWAKLCGLLAIVPPFITSVGITNWRFAPMLFVQLASFCLLALPVSGMNMIWLAPAKLGALIAIGWCLRALLRAPVLEDRP